MNVWSEEELGRWGAVEVKLRPTDEEWGEELNVLGFSRCFALKCLLRLALVENFLPQFLALQGKTMAVACRCTWRR